MSSASGMNCHISPLAFNIFFESFLTRVANSATKVSITPKCSFLPEMSFQLSLMDPPESNGRFLFQFAHNGKRGYAWLAFDQTVNVILIDFHRLKRGIRFCRNVLEYPFC